MTCLQNQQQLANLLTANAADQFHGKGKTIAAHKRQGAACLPQTSTDTQVHLNLTACQNYLDVSKGIADNALLQPHISFIILSIIQLELNLRQFSSFWEIILKWHLVQGPGLQTLQCLGGRSCTSNRCDNRHLHRQSPMMSFDVMKTGLQLNWHRRCMMEHLVFT